MEKLLIITAVEISHAFRSVRADSIIVSVLESYLLELSNHYYLINRIIFLPIFFFLRFAASH